MIHDLPTERFRPDLHPLSRLARGEARDLGVALSLLEAGAEVELGLARREGDADWAASLVEYRARLARARAVYRRAHAAADLAAAEELRQCGLDEFAAALHSGHHERLTW